MNWPGLVIILTGILYLIYSVIFRKKTTIYSADVEIIKGKEDEYFKLRLYLSVLNAFILIGVGIIEFIYDLDSIYIVSTPLIFYLINFIINVISKKEGYIKN